MRFVLMTGLLAALAAAVGVWLLPVEFFQNWNVARAGADPYTQFEAAGQAEFLIWLARLLLPMVVVVLLRIALQIDRFITWVSAVGCGVRDATVMGDRSPSGRDDSGWRSWVVRGGVVAWLGLFTIHAIDGLLARGRDWPVYRLKSGEEVLPNISLRNRQVIRYLQQTVPEDARVLVCSDQSLFFLSYYLLPRRIFHFVHPEAEFEIPRPGQERPLPAYRLEDLTFDQLAEVRPDYILEYFEGEAFVGTEQGEYRARLGEDVAWTTFWRQLEQSPDVPPYLVVLRAYSESAAAENRPRSPGGER